MPCGGRGTSVERTNERTNGNRFGIGMLPMRRREDEGKGGGTAIGRRSQSGSAAHA